jgi:hypothetical protein
VWIKAKGSWVTSPAAALAGQVLEGEGSVVVGDLGLISLKAMLENGVGYIVCGWAERPTPIDAAIADAQRTVLQRHGIRLRRMRHADAVASVITQGGIGTPPGQAHPRGLVVWQGRRGMRSTLEAFARTEVPAGVVGICFDPEILRARDVIAFDPEPTAVGFVRAMDEAFALSGAAGKPAVIVVRDSLLAARGSIHARENLTPAEAAALDQTAAAQADLLEAAAGLGVIAVEGPADPHWCVLSDATNGATVQRALDAAKAAALDARCELPTVSTITTAAVSLALPAEAASIVEAARHVALCAQEMTELARQADRPGGSSPERLVREVPARLRGDVVAGRMLRWMAATCEDADLETALLRAAERLEPQPVAIELPPSRLPARALPSQLVAGLSLAQIALGLPVRLSPAHPTWECRNGVSLTIVDAAQFGVEGVNSAAPGRQGHVFLVHGDVTSAVQAQASAASAAVEMVNMADPRAVASAIERACMRPPLAPSIICAVPMSSIVPVDPRHEVVDLDAELASEDLVTLATIAPASVDIVERHDDPLVAVVATVTDSAAIAAAQPAGSRLSAAAYRVRRRPASGFLGRAQLRIRRASLRLVGVQT